MFAQATQYRSPFVPGFSLEDRITAEQYRRLNPPKPDPDAEWREIAYRIKRLGEIQTRNEKRARITQRALARANAAIEKGWSFFLDGRRLDYSGYSEAYEARTVFKARLPRSTVGALLRTSEALADERRVRRDAARLQKEFAFQRKLLDRIRFVPKSSGCGCGCGGPGACAKREPIVKRYEGIRQADGDGSFWGVLSSGRIDRTQDVVVQRGLDFSQHASQGSPLMCDHGKGGPLPIGNVTDIFYDRENDWTIGLLNITSKTATGRECLELVRAGFLKGISLGFDPEQWEDRTGGGRIYKRATVLEVSLTAIPACQDALVCDTERCR